MRPNKDTYYLDIALAVSKRSTCLKRHYGCVIVKDDIIIATGYNGNPRGEENCCERGMCKRMNAERYSGYESCNAVHAEQNALIAASRDRLIGATVYLACENFVDFPDIDKYNIPKYAVDDYSNMYYKNCIKLDDEQISNHFRKFYFGVKRNLVYFKDFETQEECFPFKLFVRFNPALGFS